MPGYYSMRFVSAQKCRAFSQLKQQRGPLNIIKQYETKKMSLFRFLELAQCSALAFAEMYTYQYVLVNSTMQYNSEMANQLFYLIGSDLDQVLQQGSPKQSIVKSVLIQGQCKSRETDRQRECPSRTWCAQPLLLFIDFIKRQTLSKIISNSYKIGDLPT